MLMVLVLLCDVCSRVQLCQGVPVSQQGDQQECCGQAASQARGSQGEERCSNTVMHGPWMSTDMTMRLWDLITPLVTSV